MLGIDEAGRGPVLGPLVLAGVSCTDSNLSILENIEIKDSKKLTHKKRIELYDFILYHADYIYTSIIWPDIIDAYVFNSSLNVLELEYIVKAINSIDTNIKTKVFIDSPEIPEKFKSKILKTKLNNIDNIELIVENKADDKYKIVSAASIIAKVLRDNFIETLKKEFGELGTGYPSDPKTIKYLKSITKENTEYFVRKSWKTYSNIHNTLF